MTDPAKGWDARLWALWAFYSAVAYTTILAIVVGGTSLGLDLTRVAVNHHALGSLLIATVGATLYGIVLGGLQWQVLRKRLPITPGEWIRASVIPALAVWIAVVVPAAVSADSEGSDLRVTYFLAVSQALALGPLIGFVQARALRPYTRRWRSWITANLVSWLIVEGLFYLLSVLFGGFDFVHGEGSPLEAYLVLIAACPLTGRWLLWITAPVAVRSRA